MCRISKTLLGYLPGRTTALLSLLVIVGLSGCSSGLPRTYPVSGKVVFKDGKPVTDGRIEFQSTTDPSLKASGDIASDGTFSLTTYKDGNKASGAVAGPHKVVVELEQPTTVITLPDSYTVEPRANQFTIKLATQRR